MTQSVTDSIIGSLLTNGAARKAVDGVIHKVGRPLVHETMETAEFVAKPVTLVQSHLEAPRPGLAFDAFDGSHTGAVGSTFLIG